MIWKTMLGGFLLVACAPVALAAEAPEPERLTAARNVVELIMPPASRERIFAAVLDSLMGNYMAGMMQADPGIQKAMEDEPRLGPIFARFIERQKKLVLDDLRESGPELAEAYAASYARNFSQAELLDLEHFFRTPTGAKYIERTPALLTDPAIGAWQRNIAARAEGRKTEELKAFFEELRSLIEEAKDKHRAS